MQTTHENKPIEQSSDLQQLRRAVASCMPAIIAERDRETGDPTELPLADTVGLEGVYIAAQVGMWLLRGASFTDIERHIDSGELPFKGGERGMFHAVLDELTDRLGDRAQATQKAIKLAQNFDNLLAILERQGGVPRGTILPILVGQLDRDQDSQTAETNS